MRSKHILLPLDLMRSTPDPLFAAREMAEDGPVLVTLLHVIHLDIVPHDGVYAALREESEAALRKLGWLFFGSEDAVEVCVRIGHPAREIVAKAAEARTDIIVMTGSKARRRFFQSGTTQEVLQTAPCRVLVLPKMAGNNQPLSRPQASGILPSFSKSVQHSVAA